MRGRIQTLTILESYLETFPGPVIAVSHDRYFLDKFASRVFAIAPDGRILDSVGGYTDYREMAQALGAAGKAEAAPKQSTAPRSTGKRKLRFTFKEQREFDTIDETMARQESELAALDSEMSACASDYVRLQALTEKREVLEKTIAKPRSAGSISAS